MTMRKALAVLLAVVLVCALPSRADALPACSNFFQSGPIVVSADNQTFESVVITSTNGVALDTNGHKGIGLLNAVVYHCGGQGYLVNSGAGNWAINVKVVDTCAPATGQDSNYITDRDIDCENSADFIGYNLYVQDGSSGIIMHNCVNFRLTDIQGKNQRGPYPGGQFVAAQSLSYGSLTNFSNFNDPTISYPEDNISVWNSQGMTIASGLLDGNNSINGAAIQGDLNAANVTVSDVDAIHQNNECFAAYGASGVYNIFYANVRCRDMTASSYRGVGAFRNDQSRSQTTEN